MILLIFIKTPDTYLQLETHISSILPACSNKCYNPSKQAYTAHH
jgi:hypothetical protein